MSNNTEYNDACIMWVLCHIG